jgi:hypothetical protein
MTIDAPFRMRRRGVESKLHLGEAPSEIDPYAGSQHRQGDAVDGDDHSGQDIHRDRRRSSTLRSESGKRTYIIIARRMISGLL